MEDDGIVAEVAPEHGATVLPERDFMARRRDTR
jgi:hypothetical protein